MKQTLILLFVFLLSCGNENKTEKFNKEKWINGTQIERGNMSTDLVESQLLIGKTKSETIEYIGFPKDSTNLNFHYLLDFGYLTPFHLNVNFDKTDLKVKEMTISD